MVFVRPTISSPSVGCATSESGRSHPPTRRPTAVTAALGHARAGRFWQMAGDIFVARGTGFG